MRLILPSKRPLARAAAWAIAGVVLAGAAPSSPPVVITEWKVYVTNRDLVDPNSRREILRIAQLTELAGKRANAIAPTSHIAIIRTLAPVNRST
jgi:hypothetical protein